MTHADLIFRALTGYRKLTTEHHECTVRREQIAKADGERDKLVVTRTSCEIESDWIEAIEAGLPFIGKAIDEERQFILSNGHTEPIEKVKHVSKESVQHLARHSNYITREQKGEDIVPDKLYTVERLNDYAVYENRFLYMVLCRLRDFVSLRYDKILELTNTYTGELSFDKTVTFNKEKLEYRLSLNEERKDDPYLREHNPMKPVIDRIDLILRSVYYYLRTPLMSEIAKVDKLKPPITKTNVLRMDKNFKEVVTLYEFLVSYTRDGYLVKKETVTFSPLQAAVADEFAETIQLTSFLAYEHGLGLEEVLREEYEREEKRRREEEAQKLVERIAALKKRIAEEGCSPEEYMLLLEKRNRALEEDREELFRRRKEIETLQATIEELNGTIAAHGSEIAELNERHGREIAELNERYDGLAAEFSAAKEAHRTELRDAEENYYTELNARDAAHRQAMAEKEKELLEAGEALKKTQDEKAFLGGRLNALRQEHGLVGPDEDYTSQEAFEELEHQYAMFNVFFRGQWRKTKRRLRRETLKATLAAIRAQIKGKKGGEASENADEEAEKAPETEEAAPAGTSEEGFGETSEETLGEIGETDEEMSEEEAEHGGDE